MKQLSLEILKRLEELLPTLKDMPEEAIQTVETARHGEHTSRRVTIDLGSGCCVMLTIFEKT